MRVEYGNEREWVIHYDSKEEAEKVMRMLERLIDDRPITVSDILCGQVTRPLAKLEIPMAEGGNKNRKPAENKDDTE